MKYNAEPGNIGLCAGGVDELSVLTSDGGNGKKEWEELKRRAKHIFVREKAGWYTLGVDGLDVYEEFTYGPKMGSQSANGGEDA